MGRAWAPAGRQGLLSSAWLASPFGILCQILKEKLTAKFMKEVRCLPTMETGGIGCGNLMNGNKRFNLIPLRRLPLYFVIWNGGLVMIRALDNINAFGLVRHGCWQSLYAIRHVYMHGS